MQLKVWRIENLRIEGPKSRSRGSKSEVWRVHNRGLGGVLAALGAAGRSWDHPEDVVRRLGAVLGAFWVRLGELGGRLWGVLGLRRALWRFEWRQNETFQLACHLLIDFEWNLFPKVIVKSLDFIAKVLGIIVF